MLIDACLRSDGVTNSRLQATELYDLTADTGRDFDFEGYSKNVAADHASEVEALLSDLHTEVNTWY